MPFELRDACPEDALRIADIEELAYKDDPLTPIFFPGPFPGGSTDEAKATRAKEMANHLKENPTHAWKKVVDTDTGLLVAFSSWNVYKAGEPMPPIQKREFGPGCNVEACEEYWGAMYAFHENYMGERPHVFIDQLLTHPDYQRKGAGRMLVDWMVKIADDLRLPMYLDSSPYGHKLYRDAGFEDVGTTIFDKSKYGSEGTWTIWYMERPVPT